MRTAHIIAFLRECTVADDDPGENLDSMCLYGLYISWCLMTGRTPLPGDVFDAALRHHGLTPSRQDGARLYPGLRMIGPASRDYILHSVPHAYAHDTDTYLSLN